MSARSFKRAHARRLAREQRRSGPLKRKSAQIAGLALTSGALFTATAAADTFTVTTTGDDTSAAACAPATPAGTYHCTTLRDAVAAADAATSASTIDFTSGLTGTITLGTGGKLPLSGTENVTINGPGAGALTVSGNNASQIFDITSGDDYTDGISGLTLTDGHSTASPGGAIADTGGATLDLTSDTISNSVTGDTTTDTGGGAVYTEGSLTISDSSLSGNTSAEDGGAVYVHHDEASALSLTINDSTVSGNTAASNGGGIFGAKYTTITGSHITSNTQTGGGTYVGGGIATLGGSLVIDDSTVSGNTSAGLGGGIGSASKYGVTIENSTVSGNTAGSGGGFAQLGFSHVTGEGDSKYNPVTIQNSTISGNKANIGAGVNIYGVAEGDPVKIESSTISGNVGTGTKSAGGGLAVTPKYDSGNSSVYSVKSPIEVSDSTISGNAATVGGGVTVGTPFLGFPVFGQGQTESGSLTFDNSTVDGNSSSDGGGVYLGDYTSTTSSALQSATVTLRSTIVAGDAGGDLGRASGSTSGGFASAFSLIQSPGSVPILLGQSNIIGKSPDLGPLANNGGPTETMLPSGTSPVIDQGEAPKSLITDQRLDPRTVAIPGIPQPQGGDGTDIGAVELPASSVPTVFSASLRGQLLTSHVSPLLPGTASPIDCTVRIGTLNSCVIHVVSGGKLIADGDAQIGGTGTATLAVSLTPTAAGLSLIKKHPLGVTAPATISGSGDGGPQTSAGNVDVIAGPLFTIPLGKSSAKLSKGVRSDLKSVAKLLVGAGAKSITCTAYTKKGPHNGVKDKSVTSSEAKAVCGYVDVDGFKGKSKPVGKGHTTAANQVVISFKF
jgi:hypothetical protein